MGNRENQSVLVHIVPTTIDPLNRATIPAEFVISVKV